MCLSTPLLEPLLLIHHFLGGTLSTGARAQGPFRPLPSHPVQCPGGRGLIPGDVWSDTFLSY